MILSGTLASSLAGTTGAAALEQLGTKLGEMFCISIAREAAVQLETASENEAGSLLSNTVRTIALNAANALNGVPTQAEPFSPKEAMYLDSGEIRSATDNLTDVLMDRAGKTPLDASKLSKNIAWIAAHEVLARSENEAGGVVGTTVFIAAAINGIAKSLRSLPETAEAGSKALAAETTSDPESLALKAELKEKLAPGDILSRTMEEIKNRSAEGTSAFLDTGKKIQENLLRIDAASLSPRGRELLNELRKPWNAFPSAIRPDSICSYFGIDRLAENKELCSKGFLTCFVKEMGELDIPVHIKAHLFNTVLWTGSALAPYKEFPSLFGDYLVRRVYHFADSLHCFHKALKNAGVSSLAFAHASLDAIADRQIGGTCWLEAIENLVQIQKNLPDRNDLSNQLYKIVERSPEDWQAVDNGERAGRLQRYNIDYRLYPALLSRCGVASKLVPFSAETLKKELASHKAVLVVGDAGVLNHGRPRGTNHAVVLTAWDEKAKCFDGIDSTKAGTIARWSEKDLKQACGKFQMIVPNEFADWPLNRTISARNSACFYDPELPGPVCISGKVDAPSFFSEWPGKNNPIETAQYLADLKNARNNIVETVMDHCRTPGIFLLDIVGATSNVPHFELPMNGLRHLADDLLDEVVPHMKNNTPKARSVLVSLGVGGNNALSGGPIVATSQNMESLSANAGDVKGEMVSVGDAEVGKILDSYSLPTIDEQLKTDSPKIYLNRKIIGQKVLKAKDGKYKVECWIQEDVVDRKYFEHGNLSDLLAKIKNFELPSTTLIYKAIIDIIDLATFKIFRPYLYQFKVDDAKIRLRKIDKYVEKKSLKVPKPETEAKVVSLGKQIEKRPIYKCDIVTEKERHTDTTHTTTRANLLIVSFSDTKYREMSPSDLENELKTHKFIGEDEHICRLEEESADTQSRVVLTADKQISVQSYDTETKSAKYIFNLRKPLGSKTEAYTLNEKINGSRKTEIYSVQAPINQLSQIKTLEEAQKILADEYRVKSVEVKLPTKENKEKIAAEFSNGWMPSTLCLTVKSSLGEEITKKDWAFVAVDAASLVLTIATAGTLNSFLTGAGLKFLTSAGLKTVASLTISGASAGFLGNSFNATAKGLIDGRGLKVSLKEGLAAGAMGAVGGAVGGALGGAVGHVFVSLWPGSTFANAILVPAMATGSLEFGVEAWNTYQKTGDFSAALMDGLDGTWKGALVGAGMGGAYWTVGRAVNGLKTWSVETPNYNRPGSYRTGVRAEVWENAREASSGQVRDPVTGRFMSPDKPWDMGHKPGYEWRKFEEYARTHKLSRQEMLDWNNNPEHFRPELPSSNRSHLGEDMTDAFFGGPA